MSSELLYDYNFIMEKYQLQGYEYLTIKIHAVCPNYKCRKDITDIVDANKEPRFCPYCGQKVRFVSEPQLPLSIELKAHRGNDGELYVSRDSLSIW